MRLDYQAPRVPRTPRSVTLDAILRILATPLGWPTSILYGLLWAYGLFACRVPPHWNDETIRITAVAIVLNLPVFARIIAILWLRSVYPTIHAPMSRQRRALTVMLGLFSVFVPLLIQTQLPLIAGVIVSRPAMNRLHRQALAHPNGMLQDQWIGVYWAQDITPTPSGVSFRVSGSTGPYGSRSGFFSGSIQPVNADGQQWPTIDPLWTAWGYDY